MKSGIYIYREYFDVQAYIFWPDKCVTEFTVLAEISVFLIVKKTVTIHSHVRGIHHSAIRSQID